jgi:hypothetical protein
VKTPVPSLAAEVWTPQPVAAQIAATRRLLDRTLVSHTGHKRWRDDIGATR